MRRVFGLLLALGLAWPGAAQDRSKKAYELMYEDIQLLKVQTQRIEKRLDQTAIDLKSLTDLVRDLITQFKDFQTFQARSQEGLRDVPPQLQSLQEQLTQIEGRLQQISEEVLALKAKPEPTPEKKDADKPKPEEKTEPAKKPGEQPPAAKNPPPSGMSAQESWQTAMADYDKGNFDLAVDGFKLYREQFPASPLADNALYMIGECRFSQKKFPLAVDAFNDLILAYPQSDKLDSAYLKKGYALAELKKKPEAIAVLRLLLQKFSTGEIARQAQQKIKELQDIK
jgi:TolA-binding protein